MVMLDIGPGVADVYEWHASTSYDASWRRKKYLVDNGTMMGVPLKMKKPQYWLECMSLCSIYIVPPILSVVWATSFYCWKLRYVTGRLVNTTPVISCNIITNLLFPSPCDGQKSASSGGDILFIAHLHAYILRISIVAILLMTRYLNQFS